LEHSLEETKYHKVTKQREDLLWVREREEQKCAVYRTSSLLESDTVFAD